MAGKSNILIAAMAGLAVGIGIGMLIAPEKGSKIRKTIKDKILDIADKLEEGFPTSFEELKSVLVSDKATKDVEDSGQESGSTT
ncbi:MAG: YtxH domain-containing protein [Bacteroidetes bacterium]|nr:YtxH domain-containing protein [Bacteroidota bacterium]